MLVFGELPGRGKSADPGRWLGGPAGSYPLDGQAALPQIHDLR